MEPTTVSKEDNLVLRTRDITHPLFQSPATPVLCFSISPLSSFLPCTPLSPSSGSQTSPPRSSLPPTPTQHVPLTFQFPLPRTSSTLTRTAPVHHRRRRSHQRRPPPRLLAQFRYSFPTSLKRHSNALLTQATTPPSPSLSASPSPSPSPTASSSPKPSSASSSPSPSSPPRPASPPPSSRRPPPAAPPSATSASPPPAASPRPSRSPSPPRPARSTGPTCRYSSAAPNSSLNIALDLLLLSLFRVRAPSANPGLATQAGVRLACDLSAAFAGLVSRKPLSSSPRRNRLNEFLPLTGLLPAHDGPPAGRAQRTVPVAGERDRDHGQRVRDGVGGVSRRCGGGWSWCRCRRSRRRRWRSSGTRGGRGGRGVRTRRGGTCLVSFPSARSRTRDFWRGKKRSF